MTVILGIMKDFHDNHENYIKSCESEGIAYKVIDILAPDWLDLVLDSGCDGFLFHPPNDIQERKQIIDERIYIISKILKMPVYPSFEELFIYENKRMMSYWLKANKFPHPDTWVFSRKKEAIEFLKGAEYPLVFKTNIGASSSGVDIIRSRNKALYFTKNIFGYSHPALTLGRVRFSGKFHGIPLPLLGRVQKHYLIVQKFYKIKWEWRIIRLGDSWFVHQKLLEGDFASGSGKVGRDIPPDDLLKLAQEICGRGNFRSMALDIFETTEGDYLVNEMQAIFGSHKDYQMRVDDKPGRLLLQDGKFQFEEGLFNLYCSHLLRVKDFVRLIESGYYKKK